MLDLNVPLGPNARGQSFRTALASVKRGSEKDGGVVPLKRY